MRRRTGRTCSRGSARGAEPGLSVALTGANATPAARRGPKRRRPSPGTRLWPSTRSKPWCGHQMPNLLPGRPRKGLSRSSSRTGRWLFRMRWRLLYRDWEVVACRDLAFADAYDSFFLFLFFLFFVVFFSAVAFLIMIYMRLDTSLLIPMYCPACRAVLLAVLSYLLC